MEQPTLRVLIQEKLADGRLPKNHLPRIRNGPGNGEACGGCDSTVTRSQMLMEILDASGCRVQFHVGCYYVWVVERQVYGQLPRFSLPSPTPRAH